MSNAKPRPVAEINLEEFERRLRASAAPQAGVEDPLAELTRLVDTIGFERTPSERALEADRTLRQPPRPELRPAPRPELRPAPKPELRLAAPTPPAPPAAPPEPPQPRLEIESKPPAPKPAPPLADAEMALRPSFDAEDLDSIAFEPPPSSQDEVGQAVEAAIVAAASPARPTRSRNWGLKVGGLIAAAVVMAGAVVVFKFGVHARSGAPPLILASTAPTKVAPPSEATIRTANETGSLLTRDTAQPTPTPPKLVDPPEAPVDLSARQEASPSPSSEPSPLTRSIAPVPTASALAPSPAASAAEPSPAAAPSPTASATAEADASPVAPSTDTPIVAAPAPKATAAPPVAVDPSRVKTISVRPDGTLISSGYESAATALEPPPAPAPAPTPQKQAEADAEASSPAVALPTKLSPPKSDARVVSKSDTTAPADAGAGPAPVAPKPKKPKPKPAPVAEAEPTGDDAQAPAAASGGFAVQFAAPKSESEAKALIKRFESRFAGALGGAPLGVHKAERHGEPIYRVRAGGLSKAQASAMCAKVKSDGGDCYVAKN